MGNSNINLEEIYAAQQEELMEDRKKILEEIYRINNLNASNEYNQIDMQRFQYYYLGWSLASIVILLVTLKYYK
tara:strand:+ start:5399 stop:5620 length:222 start_codon:yes stop_codon:yes gene_type:complete